VVAWGNNQYGQATVPASRYVVRAISAGLNYSILVTEDNKIFSFGTNNWGQRNIPDTLSNILSATAGYANSVVTLRDGTVLTYGSKEFNAHVTRTPTPIRR
jgi:alpha-tubulin suppressor-like RCC1 family protein